MRRQTRKYRSENSLELLRVQEAHATGDADPIGILNPSDSALREQYITTWAQRLDTTLVTYDQQ